MYVCQTGGEEEDISKKKYYVYARERLCMYVCMYNSMDAATRSVGLGIKLRTTCPQPFNSPINLFPVPAIPPPPRLHPAEASHVAELNRAD